MASGYPRPYCPGLSCTWFLHVPNGFTVGVSFSSFHLADDGFLIFYNSDSYIQS